MSTPVSVSGGQAAPVEAIAPAGTPVPVDLYVYYKLRDKDSAEALLAARAMQARLAARWHVAGQLKYRTGSEPGLSTWMEVYPSVPPGFQDSLQAEANATGLAALAVGGRHAEVFMDFLSCV
jgi:hypothetical protein